MAYRRVKQLKSCANKWRTNADQQLVKNNGGLFEFEMYIFLGNYFRKMFYIFLGWETYFKMDSKVFKIVVCKVKGGILKHLLINEKVAINPNKPLKQNKIWKYAIYDLPECHLYLF